MEGWGTREDVFNTMKDLNGVGMNFDDDSFIISGAMPPPPPRHLKDEDEELELRYGRFRSNYNERPREPDLKGITKYINMVIESETNNFEENNPDETVIVISKLNPTVPEFVPKRDMGLTNKHNSSSNGVTTSAKIDEASTQLQNSCEMQETPKEATNCKEVIHEQSLEPCQNGESANGKSCDQNDDDEATILQTIIETSKGKTIKEKRARNVAIATLIKRKSKSPGSPQSPLTISSISRSDSPLATNTNNNSPKTLTLHPPNFYESKCPDAQLDIVTTLPQIVTAENRNDEINDLGDTDKDTTTSSGEPVTVTKDVNPLVEESNNKVDYWFTNHQSPKPREPPHTGPLKYKKREVAPITGPIIYKKKETNESSQSPVSEPVSKKPTYSLPGAFVPSKYASDLAKQYEERAKATEERQLDMWSKLERDLKAKDEVIKERKKAQNDASPDTSRGSSRCSSRRQNLQ